MHSTKPNICYAHPLTTLQVWPWHVQLQLSTRCLVYGQQYYYQNPYAFVGNQTQGDLQYEVLSMGGPVEDNSASDLLQQSVVSTGTVAASSSISESQDGVFDYYIPSETDSSQPGPDPNAHSINHLANHRNLTQEVPNENFPNQTSHPSSGAPVGAEDNCAIGTLPCTNVVVGIFDEAKTSYSSPDQSLFQSESGQFTRNSFQPQNSNFCSFSYHWDYN